MRLLGKACVLISSTCIAINMLLLNIEIYFQNEYMHEILHHQIRATKIKFIYPLLDKLRSQSVNLAQKVMARGN